MIFGKRRQDDFLHVLCTIGGKQQIFCKRVHGVGPVLQELPDVAAQHGATRLFGECARVSLHHECMIQVVCQRAFARSVNAFECNQKSWEFCIFHIFHLCALVND